MLIDAAIYLFFLLRIRALSWLSNFQSQLVKRGTLFERTHECEADDWKLALLPGISVHLGGVYRHTECMWSLNYSPLHPSTVALCIYTDRSAFMKQ